MEGAPSNPYETLSREVSLQALDPSPVDDSPVELSETDPFVENEETRNSHSSQSKNSASLGLSGHSTIWWCKFPVLPTQFPKILADLYANDNSTTNSEIFIIPIHNIHGNAYNKYLYNTPNNQIRSVLR